MKTIDIPKILHEIPDPPHQLYIRGNFPDPDKHLFLTVVGSRKYTAYGKEVCENIIHELQGYPVVIISGLAKGIDSIAHRAALKAGLITIAIPGSGLSPDVLYPKIHRHLAEDIIQNGGCLISEYLPHFRAQLWSFPKRNRIMAGIAQATLVIESDRYSGSQITARLALEYNREVCAIPSSILDTEKQGANLLIQQGAYPILSAQDIINLFHLKNLQKR